MSWTILLILAAAGACACLYFMEIKVKRGLTEIDKGFRIPDMRLHYGARELYECLENIGADGRALIKRYWLTDYGFILCFWVIMLGIGRNNVSVPQLRTAMAIAASVRAALDILENTMLLALTRAYPEKRRDRLASICGYTTGAKFAALGIWVACLFAALFISAIMMAR